MQKKLPFQPIKKPSRSSSTNGSSHSIDSDQSQDFNNKNLLNKSLDPTTAKDKNDNSSNKRRKSPRLIMEPSSMNTESNHSNGSKQTNDVELNSVKSKSKTDPVLLSNGFFNKLKHNSQTTESTQPVSNQPEKTSPLRTTVKNGYHIDWTKVFQDDSKGKKKSKQDDDSKDKSITPSSFYSPEKKTKDIGIVKESVKNKSTNSTKSSSQKSSTRVPNGPRKLRSLVRTPESTDESSTGSLDKENLTNNNIKDTTQPINKNNIAIKSNRPSRNSATADSRSSNSNSFSEPPLADPVTSVTGLPLGSFPSHKIQKERLWNAKKGKKGRPNGNFEKGDSNTDDESSIAPVYNANLKTQLSNKLQKPSSIRSVPRPVPKYNSDNEGIITSEPSTPKKRRLNSIEDKEKDKRRIKNASPTKGRRNAFGFETQPELPEKRTANSPELPDSTKDNDDFCSSCGETGIFLCCESCPRSFHFACCDPPYYEDSLPDEEWFCNECFAKRHPPKAINSGMFGKLLDQIPYRNPTQFRLPKRIRERFEGVVTGKFGEYEDTDYKPYNAAQINSFNQFDPAHNLDKDGNPKICVKCGESGINPNAVNGGTNKLIMQCEYCPSSWHLDCLDPPLSTSKLLGTRWKCPNHADHLIVNEQRRLKKPIFIDVDKTRGYKNNGHVDIKSDSEEEDENDSDESGSEDVQDIPTPPQLKTYDTEYGVGALLPPKTVKLWTDPFVIPRIPAKGVILDFIGKCVDSRAIQNEKINEIWRLSKENNEMLSNIGRGYNDREQQAIKSLAELKELDFQELLDIANRETKSTDNVDDDNVDPHELEDLKKIKKLMSLKGRAKLLEFLETE